MEIPLQITFNNLPWSEAVEAAIRAHAAKLDRYHQHVMSCRVVVEVQHRHHHHGNHYHVRVEVKVPGAVLVASREPETHHRYTDMNVAIRDAFDSMRRQLEDHARMEGHRAEAHAAHKAHEAPPHGRIVEIYPSVGYGRIETADGRLIYFHRNSVIDAEFDKLEVGAEVRFSEELGEHGPQASTVHLIGKHSAAA